MLVVERAIGSKVFVSDLIEVEVLKIRQGGRVKLGISAPKSLPIRRDEHLAQLDTTGQVSPRILIIEDDADFTELLELAFRAIGAHDTSHLTSYAETLAYLDEPKTEPYDLILCDHKLGDGDGSSLVSSIRSTPGYERTPIVMLSAFMDDHAVDAALDAGANACLEKSGCPEQLSQFASQLVGFWCNTSLMTGRRTPALTVKTA